MNTSSRSLKAGHSRAPMAKGVRQAMVLCSPLYLATSFSFWLALHFLKDGLRSQSSVWMRLYEDYRATMHTIPRQAAIAGHAAQFLTDFAHIYRNMHPPSARPPRMKPRMSPMTIDCGTSSTFRAAGGAGGGRGGLGGPGRGGLDIDQPLPDSQTTIRPARVQLAYNSYKVESEK